MHFQEITKKVSFLDIFGVFLHEDDLWSKKWSSRGDIKILFYTKKHFSNLKLMHLLRSYKKVSFLTFLAFFYMKTTSDQKSEVIKVAFKFDFTSENIFQIWNQAIFQEVTKKVDFFWHFRCKIHHMAHHIGIFYRTVRYGYFDFVLILN